MSILDVGVNKVLSWARAHSFWYVSTGESCCANELTEALGCRYDLERFGCKPETDPRHADVLIVTGSISRKAAPELKQVYDQMLSPKHVIALGACACGGGPFFDSEVSATVLVEKVVPVDVFVPGCPPRPEAIMNGILKLQEKVLGKS